MPWSFAGPYWLHSTFRTIHSTAFSEILHMQDCDLAAGALYFRLLI